MRVKINSHVLFVLATLLYAISWFTTSLVPSFLCGLCFGLIFQNGIDERKSR
jgi:hypothetical protein